MSRKCYVFLKKIIVIKIGKMTTTITEPKTMKLPKHKILE